MRNVIHRASIAGTAIAVSGCRTVSAPSPDVLILAGAIKFAAVCGVLCSLIWAAALIFKEIYKRRE